MSSLTSIWPSFSKFFCELVLYLFQMDGEKAENLDNAMIDTANDDQVC